MVTVDQSFGSNSNEPIEVSISEAEKALSDIAAGIEHLNNEDFTTNTTNQAVTEFTTTAETMITLIDNRADVETRGNSQLPEHFNNMRNEIVTLRDNLSSNVAASDRLLGQIGNIARFLVGFLVPVAVILIYRELMRRQQRQSELETRLEAERQINAAREQFIANASHELRTPLTSIMGLSMMLSENEAVHHDPAALELVSIIVGESEDLARMVEDLLTVARLDAGALHYSFENIDITEELEEITEGAHRSGMTVTTTAQDATIRADRLRFRQILRNLLSNAKKYGGPQIGLCGYQDNRTYVIEITDNGRGIPEHLQGRIFERFIHQGEEVANKDSVGLGLSIVHSLTNDMGGSIQYHYTAGQSCFTIRLPLTTTEGTNPTAPEPQLATTPNTALLDHATQVSERHTTTTPVSEGPITTRTTP
jgi:signal transduction histidine kinase